MLNTVHLLTFLTVAEVGSYSAAAERLHLTQPAVSHQIRLLEKQLGGVRLFRRVAQRMMLTHAGEELLPDAREIIQLAERAEMSMLALRGHITGRVSLGCSPSTGAVILPPLLHQFQALYPAVAVRIEVASSDQVQAWLQHNRVQIGLLEEPVRRRGWESIHVADEPLVFCVPPQHPWLSDPLLTVGMLRDVPLILPPLGTPLRRAIDDGLRRAGLSLPELQVVLETESSAAISQAILSGIGFGWLPLSCVPTTLSSISPGGLNISLAWYLVGNKDHSLGRAVHDCRAFLAHPDRHPLLRQAGLIPQKH